MDDAASARAASVPFIGIASPAGPRREELLSLFQAQGAAAVLENVNQLDTVL